MDGLNPKTFLDWHWLTRSELEMVIGRKLDEDELQRIRVERAKPDARPEFIFSGQFSRRYDQQF